MTSTYNYLIPGNDIMNDYLDANRTLWNAWTQLHAESPFYDLPGFKAGKSSLRRIELAELGDKVDGKTLLHLQCHYGQDTLSWARRGAIVTGVDFSPESIALARSLERRTRHPSDVHLLRHRAPA